MICYALVCEDGHRFDSWFRDSAAYEAQRTRALVVCPACGSSTVAKAIMAPAVVGSRALAAETLVEAPAPMDVGLLDAKSRDLRALVQGFREKLLAEGHDVGAGFAAEARRMHEGETPQRQIYGQASLSEARDLLDDGIFVLPLPAAPDDLN